MVLVFGSRFSIVACSGLVMRVAWVRFHLVSVGRLLLIKEVIGFAELLI